jgi:hypothetical protein
MARKNRETFRKVLCQRSFYFDHSGLDPESSLFNWIPAFAGMTTLIIIVNEVVSFTAQRVEER